jgi:hypothetical protein
VVLGTSTAAVCSIRNAMLSRAGIGAAATAQLVSDGGRDQLAAESNGKSNEG